MYQLTPFQNIVKRLADGAFIPNDEDNRDWVAYQKWLTDGNIPAPATS